MCKDNGEGQGARVVVNSSDCSGTTKQEGI